jgi:small multidrug resistance family-3 protein
MSAHRRPLSLAVFTLALTRAQSAYAGRTYAAYGGIYILLALCWLWGIEKTRPDRWDVRGVAICILGSAVNLLGPRARKRARKEAALPA